MDSIAIPPDAADYPAALLALKGPPTLFVRGSLPAAPGVAVVGTREASEAACAFTCELVAALVRAGLAVWSGGALGIDAAAHEAALSAGGITVLVAGGGLDRPYPARHRGLFERVLASGGALVARVADGTPPMPAYFLQRNEILAALTQATVVVEAGLASGARSTAAAARRLGRPLCVVPHPPWDPRGQGCALELARGARAIYSASEVLEVLGRPLPPLPRSPARSKKERPSSSRALPLEAASPPRPPPADLTAAESLVYAALSSEPLHLDEVCERIAGQAAPGAILGVLLTLTLRTVVVEGPAGFFRRTSRP